ncbi:hypothetical protein Glove_117g602 [Diversispora epigaea]|uniref:Uncharacterized protein n=1 Tax=Diversispora epigaea TaxID=1348612 RepID=A0A397J6Y8_9GLOM|nr:hypothetical protein Glove_117g602 [Diversispora epigaea]
MQIIFERLMSKRKLSLITVTPFVNYNNVKGRRRNEKTDYVYKLTGAFYKQNRNQTVTVTPFVNYNNVKGRRRNEKTDYVYKLTGAFYKQNRNQTVVSLSTPSTYNQSQWAYQPHQLIIEVNRINRADRVNQSIDPINSIRSHRFERFGLTWFDLYFQVNGVQFQLETQVKPNRQQVKLNQTELRRLENTSQTKLDQTVQVDETEWG